LASLIIESPLAEQLRSIAAQEQRSVEAVIQAMVEKYTIAPTDEELNIKLRSLPGISVPPDEPGIPPLTEAELHEIAQRAGAQGSLSELIISERKQGW
jgi:hypothetical protein